MFLIFIFTPTVIINPLLKIVIYRLQILMSHLFDNHFPLVRQLLTN